MILTELFMAKAGKGKKGYDKCFYGTIKRDCDENGNPVVYGKIKVNDGYIYATSCDQQKLGDSLDEMVMMIVYGNLHKDSGKTTIITETPFYLN